MRKASAARENSVDPPRNEITSNPVGRQMAIFAVFACCGQVGRYHHAVCRVDRVPLLAATRRVHISGMSGWSFSPSRDASVVD
jgi:hypothetical protein